MNIKGFTLIELLIVVTIIAILPIAAPNFLKVHTRSTVSRAQADMRNPVRLKGYNKEVILIPITQDLLCTSTPGERPSSPGSFIYTHPSCCL